MHRYLSGVLARTTTFLILTQVLASCEGGGPAAPSSDVRLSATAIVFSMSDDQRPVTITNLGNAPIDWRLLSTSASWLRVLPAVGTVPAHSSEEIIVQVDRAAVAQGTHTASLQLQTGSESYTLDVSVQQGGAAAAKLEPGTIVLGPLDESGVLKVTNTGGSALNWNLASAAGWASLRPASGTLAPGGSSQVVVTANRTGLTRGTYSGTLYLSSNGGSPIAAMTIEVGDGAGLHLNPASLTFGLSVDELPLQIVNEGYQALNWSAAPGAPWLSLSARSGSVPPRSSSQLTVRVERAGLPHGLHEAAIQVTSNGGSAAASVSMNAAPSGTIPNPSTTPPQLQLSPPSLDFGDSVVERSFIVYNSGDEPLDWTAETEARWVTITPSSGRVSPHSSSSVAVRVLRGGLAIGTHETDVQFDSNGGTRSGGILAHVSGPGSPPPPPPDPDPDPDPAPPKLAVTPASLDFGEAGTELSLLIQNKGGSTLQWSAEPSNGWVTLPVSSGQVTANGSQTVTLRASRSGLSAAGQYTSSVQFSSTGGNVVVAISLKVPAAPPPPPPPGGGSELDDIDPTGARDVTEQLNAYLASRPVGAVVRFPAGARYRVEGVIQLIEKTNLTIEGNGALIFATTDGSKVIPPEDLKHLWPRQRSHLEIYGGSNIVIRDLAVRGANPNAGSADGAYVEALEGQHGFDIRGVNGLLLEGVTATDTYGDLLYISGIPGTGWSRNVTVRDSHFERSGRQGIAITGGENVAILDTYIGEIGRTAIDLEPATAGGGARFVRFEGNTFGACRHLLMNSGGVGPNVENISFIGNRLVGIGLKIRVRAADNSRRANYLILDNVSEIQLGLPIAAIRFAFVDGIEVRENYQAMSQNRDMTAVTACASTDALVRDNDFPGSIREFEASAVCPEDEE
jgi:hypothetical protein